MRLRPRHRIHEGAERGYILLVLLLIIALLTIGAAAIAPSIVFQVRRDREEELIHRGVQYSRAVKHFFKKVGRYPTRIEELESTNNIRFLRKRYKDPITGKDFKLLHLGEVQMALGPGAAGGLSPAAANSASGQGNQLGQSSSSAFGGTVGKSAPAAQATADANPADGPANDAMNTVNQSDASATTTAVKPGTANNSEPGSSNDKVSQVFGGGPVVGVVSTSKDESIREFNKKNHYNQWLFIYDPQSDRGGLLNTPAQPALQGATAIAVPPGTAGTPGSAFGNQGMGNPGSAFGGTQQPPPQSAPRQQ